jgi:small-conductance mechanosensitive channel
MKYLLILTLGVCSLSLIYGQHLPDSGRGKIGNDTTGGSHLKRQEKVDSVSRKRSEYFRDTTTRKARNFDSSLFTNIDAPSMSDYAEELRKVYQFLSEAQTTTQSFTKLDDVQDKQENEDDALLALKDRMSDGGRAINIRNVQMINTVLDALEQSNARYTNYLDQCDTTLDKVKSEIADIRKDSMMRQIFRDTTLRNTFRPQLRQLRAKWRTVDSLVIHYDQEINNLASQASAHAITIGELLSEIDLELNSFSKTAFGKERTYIWEKRTTNLNSPRRRYRGSIDAELQLARFYFLTTNNHRLWLLPLGLLFFFWISSNFRRLRKLNKLEAVERLHIKYIDAYPLISSSVFILSLAPLFDMRAPAIYLELIQLLLIILLTFIFRTRLNRPLYYGWCVFIILFLIPPVSRVMGLRVIFNRWIYLTVDIIVVSLVAYFLFTKAKKFGKFVSFALGFFLFFKILGLICNVFGRVTLSQIFGETAVYSFAQIISLGIFVHVMVEAFLLQIQTARVRKKYPDVFDFSRVSRSIFRFAAAVAFFLWLLILTTNLNLWDSLYDLTVDVFTSNRQVGNFNFTLGGILLFVGIIWLANFLQKYIGYFFGDTGDDSVIDDKGQRSRLMVTRLILLTAGFLLAVAASGLSVDRITVILGALGVGIGLGLQSIVNNFVSGVILIFDRPLRIGDTVDIGDKRGRVKEIGIRSSTLLTEEGAEVIIPNGDVLSHNIVNWTLSNNHVREAVSFIVQKPGNFDEAGANDIKNIVKKIPNVMEQRDPEVQLSTLSSKTVEIKVFFWIDDFNKNDLTLGEVKTAIYKYLEGKGILLG